MRVNFFETRQHGDRVRGRDQTPKDKALVKRINLRNVNRPGDPHKSSYDYY